MVADKREFVRLDVGYLDNPKVADALESSPHAVLLHIASMLYARQHRTDGVVVVRRLLRKVGGEQVDADLLFELGLWHNLGDGKAELHDYLDHQESAEQIKKLSEAGKKGATSRWAKDRNADRIPNGNADRNAEESRGEQRRADSPRADVPDRADMNPDAILQSHGLPESERRAFKAWLVEDRKVKYMTPWLTKVQTAGEVPELIQAWRAATKPKKLHPTRDPNHPHYGQDWMANQ